MSDLYRIDWKKLTEGLDDKELLFIEGCVREATIERCEHGKIDRHPYSYVAYVARDLTDDDWCPGAAVEETP